MDKIWYILINSRSEGPFSVEDLKKELSLTPDTLVWREGFASWKKAREVPEFKDLFKDEPEPESLDPKVDPKTNVPQDELVLDMGQQPPYLFWLLAAAIVIAYAITQLYWK